MLFCYLTAFLPPSPFDQKTCHPAPEMQGRRAALAGPTVYSSMKYSSSSQSTGIRFTRFIGPPSADRPKLEAFYKPTGFVFVFLCLLRFSVIQTDTTTLAQA